MEQIDLKYGTKNIKLIRKLDDSVLDDVLKRVENDASVRKRALVLIRESSVTRTMTLARFRLLIEAINRVNKKGHWGKPIGPRLVDGTLYWGFGIAAARKPILALYSSYPEAISVRIEGGASKKRLRSARRGFTKKLRDISRDTLQEAATFSFYVSKTPKHRRAFEKAYRDNIYQWVADAEELRIGRQYQETIEYAAPSCVSCKVNIGTHFCDGCEEVYYCGEECQIADWKAGHAESCGH